MAPNLPFTARDLQQGLARLLYASGIGLAELYPELFGFRVEDRLGQKAIGSSMTVAALLALLDALSGRAHDRLRCACAVVEPADGPALRPVEAVPAKLGAFVRECGRGTLLVRAAGCAPAARFDRHFATVWAVETWGDLAGAAERAGLLDAFLRPSPLDRHKLEIAKERVRALANDQHRPARALELALRISRAPFTADVPVAASHELRRTIIDLHRHLGRHEEAVRAARAERDRLARRGTLASYDDQARAAAVYAASLFDAHRFDEIDDVLGSWSERLTAEPRLVSALTRVMVHNTLGRSQVVTGRGDWEANFRRSLATQKALDPSEVPRTRNYWIIGLLRHDRLAEADRAIRRLRDGGGLDRTSRWFVHFERAELARRRGEVWSEPEMEAGEVEPGRAGHPFGLYFQATARQPGRAPGDALARFEKARRFFLADVAEEDAGNILVFLAECMRLGQAARGHDLSSWRRSLASIWDYLGLRSNRGLSRHYRPALPDPAGEPDPEAAERLLRRVPFF